MCGEEVLDLWWVGRLRLGLCVVELGTKESDLPEIFEAAAQRLGNLDGNRVLKDVHERQQWWWRPLFCWRE